MELANIFNNYMDAEDLYKQAQERAIRGDHNTAVNYLTKAIDKFPKYTEAYTMLGNCQECLEKNDDAIASYNKALEIDPSHADAWFNKGMVLKKMGRTKESAQCIEKSIDLYCGR
jgi:tetratricopeptide (TPR) repeat protein